MVWLRAIKAASVTMLRSRDDRHGRFQTSPSSVLCVYFSRAGATMCTSFCIFVSSPCTGDKAIRESVANAAASNFIQASCRHWASPEVTWSLGDAGAVPIEREHEFLCTCGSTADSVRLTG